MNAKSRYDHLSSYRSQFLDTAVQCSKLTIPYLIQRDEFRVTHQSLRQPWQSVGAKGVVTLASKLMLSLLPPQPTFFKLQLRDDKLGEELAPERAAVHEPDDVLRLLLSLLLGLVYLPLPCLQSSPQ